MKANLIEEREGVLLVTMPIEDCYDCFNKVVSLK